MKNNHTILNCTTIKTSQNLLKIGHTTYQNERTGVTVILPTLPATCGVWCCGSAPATRENALLDASNTVTQIHSLVFSGGSAYGCDSSAGVMKWLREHNIGIPTPAGVIPIVPTACIYDLDVGEPIYPNPNDTYLACKQVSYQTFEIGQVGAGSGAQINKWIKRDIILNGGVGWAEYVENDLTIVAMAVVNAAGEIIKSNEKSTISIKDTLSYQNLISTDFNNNYDFFQLQNTTLVAVATNARFDKSACTRLAKMASAGIARSIRPCFSGIDGDIVYCISNGNITKNEVYIGFRMAELVQQAILGAVTISNTLHASISI